MRSVTEQNTYPGLTLTVRQCKVFEVTDEAGVTEKRSKEKREYVCIHSKRTEWGYGESVRIHRHICHLCVKYTAGLMHILFHGIICHHTQAAQVTICLRQARHVLLTMHNDFATLVFLSIIYHLGLAPIMQRYISKGSLRE